MSALLPPPDFFSNPYLYIFQARDILWEIPLAVGAIILLTFLATWALFYFLHQQQLSDLRERIRLREDQLVIKEKENSQRKATLPNSEIAGLKNQQLEFGFSETWLDRSNPNLRLVFVRVRNPATSTIIGVSVRIESISKMDEPGQSDVTRGLTSLYRLPLMLHTDPDRPPRREIDLHAGDTAVFDVVTLQQNGIETVFWHALWHEITGRGLPHWSQRPSGAVPPGRYRVQLKAQGRDVPAETLSIEFENTPGNMWVR